MGIQICKPHSSANLVIKGLIFLEARACFSVHSGIQPDLLRNCRTGCGHARGVRHGASRRTRFRNPLDSKWISDFRMDFWISGFQSGFLDFKVDFWISKRISGFQSGFFERFLDFKRISGFQSGFLDFKVDFSRDFWISSEFLDFKADFWISFEPLLF